MEFRKCSKCGSTKSAECFPNPFKGRICKKCTRIRQSKRKRPEDIKRYVDTIMFSVKPTDY